MKYKAILEDNEYISNIEHINDDPIEENHINEAFSDYNLEKFFKALVLLEIDKDEYFKERD